VKEALNRAEDATLRAFELALPVVNWLFFVVGLAGAVATIAGLIPPFTGSLWAKITSTLLWLLLAREGFEPIAERRAGGRDELTPACQCERGGCQCARCKADGPHDSGCAVHNSPAVPVSACDCGIAGVHLFAPQSGRTT
jgi:hypothetical protein